MNNSASHAESNCLNMESSKTYIAESHYKPTKGESWKSTGADFAGDKKTRRSTTASGALFFNGAVSWLVSCRK